jgi:hypothetical protein
MNFGRKFALFFTAAALLTGIVVLVMNPFGSNFSVSAFHPINNCPLADSTFVVDLDDAINQGIVIPTVKQVPGGKFVFSFEVRNNKAGSRNLSYKIYYQNESYKEQEYEDEKDKRYEHVESENNFYGSWENTDVEFKEIPELGWFETTTVTDSFRIVGNPRNEEKYFGGTIVGQPDEKELNDMITGIKSDTVWLNSIAQKAEANNISLDDQVKLDALFMINERNKEGAGNNRWKRNPRMGSYRFMLVVMETKAVNAVPLSVRNIAKTEHNGHAINPFYYFVHGAGKADPSCNVVIAAQELKVAAHLTGKNGVYINPFDFADRLPDTANYCRNCNESNLLAKRAVFAQYFHHEDRSAAMPMIQSSADIGGTTYSQKQYAANVKAPIEKMSRDYFRRSYRPCETVSADPKSGVIEIQNPGNDSGMLRKEHVGIMTRLGTTYGTYRVCAQFPQLLSNENVWNGIVNAIWLRNQDEAAWNSRSICEGGYIPKSDNRGAKAVRKTVQNYSEINMKILKTSVNWPDDSYAKVKKPVPDHPEQNRDVVVTCSNWDLACTQPEKHVKGVMPLAIDKYRFDLHRWDSWYQAVTIRSAFSHDKLFRSPFFWYEIEWTPQHIVWRVGPDKNSMTAVGYMDKTFTTIPDNQMIMIIAQEFNDSEWWKPAPFDQRNIPYPKNPVKGKIIAVEIE